MQPCCALPGAGRTFVMFIFFRSALKASLVGAKTVATRLGSFRVPAHAGKHGLREREPAGALLFNFAQQDYFPTSPVGEHLACRLATHHLLSALDRQGFPRRAPVRLALVSASTRMLRLGVAAAVAVTVLALVLAGLTALLMPPIGLMAALCVSWRPADRALCQMLNFAWASAWASAKRSKSLRSQPDTH